MEPQTTADAPQTASSGSDGAQPQINGTAPATSSEPEIPSLVKDVAAAFSLHVKASNRRWVTLSGVALFVLPRLPRPGHAVPKTIPLPWGIARIPTEYYYLVAVLLVSILSMSFCASYAQMIWAHSVAVKTAERYTSPPKPFGSMIDVLELLMPSSFLRVAPLTKILRRDALGQLSPRRAKLGSLYYLVLRCLGMLVFFLFPAAALATLWWVHESRAKPIIDHWAIHGAVRAVVLVASFTLLQTLLNDFLFTVKIFKEMKQRSASPDQEKSKPLPRPQAPPATKSGAGPTG